MRLNGNCEQEVRCSVAGCLSAAGRENQQAGRSWTTQPSSPTRWRGARRGPL